MARVLKPQPQMSPIAEEYAATVMTLSKIVRDQSRTVLDIAYGSEEAQGLDLYLPESDSSDALPVLMFIHGGGWRNGYKEWMGFMAPAITCLPAIFVSVGYRLAPEAKFPLPVEDCRNAVRWVYDNIAEHGGDPNRLFVGGHSAGGHLAALITLEAGSWSGVGLPADVIKGCFPVSGAFDFSDRERESAIIGSADDVGPASPINHVSGNTVPFFIAIGENDMPDLVRQAPAMADALRPQPGAVEIAEFEGCDHFKISVDSGDVDGLWATTVRRWMASPPRAQG